MAKTIKNAQGGSVTVSDELAEKMKAQGWVDVNDQPKKRGRPAKVKTPEQE